MRRSLLALSAAVALAAASVSNTLAQETTTGPAAHPVPAIAGQSATQPSGGVSSGGATSEEAAPLPPAQREPLQPGPPAGEQRAEFLSTGAMIAGGVAITAVIVCALACFSNTSSTTTSTVVQHR
jgi:hypothetical protein